MQSNNGFVTQYSEMKFEHDTATSFKRNHKNVKVEKDLEGNTSLSYHDILSSVNISSATDPLNSRPWIDNN